MDNQFKPINTQEEFDALISQRLQRERDSISKQYADYEEIKAKLSEIENENSNLKNQVNDFTNKHATSESTINELNSKIKSYETDSAKTRIALEMGLPYDLAQRLKGENEEDLRKDAEMLYRMIGNNKPAPFASNENQNINNEKVAYKQLLESLK